MNNLKSFILVLLALFSVSTHAAEEEFLTVDELVRHGYVKLSGERITEIMNKHKIKVVDIETDAVSISKSEEAKAGMEREFKETQSDKASFFLDSRLIARAPPLDGKIERKVVGDALVATDGVRTYNYTLYEKDGRMFAVRDIDAGNVFFEVQLK
ncbi:MAG: hypothetical protein OQK44_01355 [Gammaproteobacteria bacterium]|jgi:hypothetical protein|nr:hypothetical protein [Gammaproteobacteria bacterium]